MTARKSLFHEDSGQENIIGMFFCLNNLYMALTFLFNRKKHLI